jgi:chloramphenicol 3-O phosphotransferase
MSAHPSPLEMVPHIHHPSARQTMSGMAVDVVVLNGGSSAGKTSIGRRLQDLLPRPWLLLGVDDLIDVAPSSLVSYGPQGEVVLGDQWRALEAAWSRGVAAMARAGAGVIIDDIFLDGAVSQQRASEHLEGLQVLWVGVHCDPEVAAARERARGDRPAGMAVGQAIAVHRGVVYDLVVDSSTTSPQECAALIAARVT